MGSAFMKNNTIAIFLAAYFLFLAAHVGFSGAPAAAAPMAAAPAAPEAAYQLEPVSAAQSLNSKDRKNQELASCEYQLLALSVANLEELALPDAEAANRNVEAFNARMASMMEEFEDYGREVSGDAQSAYQDGNLIAPYYDRVNTEGAILGGVVSLRIEQVGWCGGFHPNHLVYGCLFDLATGQFILEPSQLADDPAAFQAGIGERLIEKADGWTDGSWGYWDDYQDIITGGSGVTVLDETGLTVVYAPYELGCYAIGMVELHLDWEELADLLGPGGLDKLGVELPEAAE